MLSLMKTSPRVKMLCQSCNRTGLHTIGAGKPRWCRCGKGSHGPIVAAPGTIVRYTFESASDAAFRKECQLAGKEERDARDNLTDRWVKCGKGYRELPMTSPKRQKLEKAYEDALAKLEALQAKCPHEGRSMFDREMCDCCYMHVESDIAQFQHLMREGIYDRHGNLTIGSV